MQKGCSHKVLSKAPRLESVCCAQYLQGTIITVLSIYCKWCDCHAFHIHDVPNYTVGYGNLVWRKSRDKEWRKTLADQIQLFQYSGGPPKKNRMCIKSN